MQPPVDIRDSSAVADLFDLAADLMRSSPLRKGCTVRLPGTGRLLVTGDLHDNPIHLKKVVKLAGLEKSPEHHLILHEMIHSERLINNMDFSHRILIKAAELVVQYPLQVHPLLANHEMAQLTGAGVTKGAGNSVELFEEGLAFAFGDDAEFVSEALKRFIAAFALALLSDSGVCCSHSLPAPHLMNRFDATVLDRELAADDYLSPFGQAYLMVWGRGHTAEQIEQLAAMWNVRLFCIGHEKADTGFEVVTPRLVVLNSDHERAAVVPIDLANVPDVEELMMGVIPLSAIGE